MVMDVLVTGAGALLGQGIIKSLRLSRQVRRIVGCDLSPRAVGLHLSDTAHLLPRFDAPTYVDALIEVARKHRVDAILCGTDLEVPIIARHREAIATATSALVVVSDPRAVEIADDKWATCEFLREHGFDAPKSALDEGAEKLAAEVGFPLIVKPRVGAGSIGLSKVRNIGELRTAMAAGGMIAQEYLHPDDEEYTVGALVFEGRCHAVVSLRRTLRFGNTHTAVCSAFPDVDAYVRKVAEALPGARGPTNFQLRRTTRGPVIFEINARFSGTTPLRTEFGFNEVEATLLHLRLGAPIPQVTLRPGLMLRWTSEVFVPLDDLDRLTAEGTLESPKGELLEHLVRR
jgi:carbamoyl-phosphate synthase large subunit